MEAEMHHDVIVVGTRVAGAATAMLLARAGLRVLAVDRARFPSDTVSSHQVQLPGIALLHRWGLLDRLVRAGTPATTHVRFDPGPVVLHGRFPEYGGQSALFSPRRTVLDAMLVQAAREAGAEVVEGARVTAVPGGVRGTGRDGPWRADAPLVIGADGKHSTVARQVGARVYRQRPVGAFACYGYVAGMPTTAGELYQRPDRTVAVFPTNDELTMVYVSAPIAEFDAFRRDIEGSYLNSLDRCGDLGERVRAGRIVEHLRTTPDQPNFFRQPHGPGWALVGDAGVVMDSITAQGISNALRDADRLATAVVAGLGGSRPLAGALRAHHRERDRALRPMFDFTVGLTRFRPLSRLQRALFTAMAGQPAEFERFLAAFAGITPIDRYLSLGTAARVLGHRLCRQVPAPLSLVPAISPAPGDPSVHRGDPPWGAR
jgi:2-polyprenyl-6-methoxyphenol hydroxylase-like FAD-dependent oxidoreductase